MSLLVTLLVCIAYLNVCLGDKCLNASNFELISQDGVLKVDDSRFNLKGVAWFGYVRCGYFRNIYINMYTIQYIYLYIKLNYL